MSEIYDRIAGKTSSVQMMIRFKAWANARAYADLARLDPAELTKTRLTNFGSIAHTMNHLYVVDDIFRAHLEGRKHGYTARNTDDTPPFDDLRRAVESMDAWYIELADQLSLSELAEPIRFTFVGGGEGMMTREQILLHIVNHGTYHRGFVSDMLNQIAVRPTPNDLPVYLRDVWYDGDSERAA